MGLGSGNGPGVGRLREVKVRISEILGFVCLVVFCLFVRLFV